MTDKTTVISKEVIELEEQLLTWRRHMHKHPELSFQEYETSTYIREQLAMMENVEVTSPTPTSVMATIRGKQKGDGRVIAIRADIDALPMQEDNLDCSFASVNEGVMHSCGHDGHAAILLGATKILAKKAEELCGEVRMIFQHAEELPPGGAVEIVKAGALDGVEEAYALHLSSSFATGTFGVKSGALTSATDRFDIVIEGKGGHSAFPHTTIDPIVTGAQVITALQNIVSRQTSAIEPVVVSICQVQSGQAYNIIPGTMTITGSTRTFGEEIREELPKKMERIVKGICDSVGATYTFTFSKGYASVVNDEHLTEVVKELLLNQFGKERVFAIEPLMPGEDFAAFHEKCPGMFVELGAGDPKKGCDYPHHNVKYKMDEDALLFGTEYFVRLVEHRLTK